MTSGGLELTATRGASWTPIAVPGLDVAAVRAMGMAGKSGWLVSSTKDGAGLLMSVTHDLGSTWATNALPGSFPDGTAAVAVDAVDDSTAWVAIKMPFSAAESIGYALATTDGGATWVAVNLPFGDGVAFQSRLDGWQAGGAVFQSLNRTRDGGKTWQPIEVAVPPAYSGFRVSYSNPVFFGSNAVLPIFLSNPGSGPLVVAFYTSGTAGESWSLGGTVSAAPDGSWAPFAVTGPTAWVVASNGHLWRTADGATYSSTPITDSGIGAIASLSADSSGLWATASSSACTVAKTTCTTQEGLEHSVDGGATWVAAAP